MQAGMQRNQIYFHLRRENNEMCEDQISVSSHTHTAACDADISSGQIHIKLSSFLLFKVQSHDVSIHLIYNNI